MLSAFESLSPCVFLPQRLKGTKTQKETQAYLLFHVLGFYKNRGASL